MRTTIDLLPSEIRLIIGQDNDKVLSAGPFTINGDVISREGKRLRFLIKGFGDADADAVLDVNSVDDPAIVLGVGDAADGVWAIDIRDQLPPPDYYRWRIDLSSSASNDTDRETVALGTLRVRTL